MLQVNRKGPGKRRYVVAQQPTQMFPRLPGTKKIFLILFRKILCPQKMFPSLRSPRNTMSINVSATMCARLPGPLSLYHVEHEKCHSDILELVFNTSPVAEKSSSIVHFFHKPCKVKLFWQLRPKYFYGYTEFKVSALQIKKKFATSMDPFLLNG